MTNAGHESSRVDAGNVDTIVSAYVAEAGGDPWLALRRVVIDALADLLELERRSRRAERLTSRGYVRGGRPRPPATNPLPKDGNKERGQG
jgi:hypothetical protein